MPHASTRRKADEPHLCLLKDLAFQPVFIQGFHRSGTTLLYRLLTATGRFNFVTSYHLIRYDEILSNHANGNTERAKRELDGYFQSLGIKDRIIDKVAVTSDLPEEYGFRLLSLSSRPRLNQGNLQGFVELCRKVQITSDPEKVLLLKNPWDFANFLFIKSAVPDARFVFIHRHPIDILNSQLRASRAMISRRCPYMALVDPYYGSLFRNPVRLFALRILYSAKLGYQLRSITDYLARATTQYLRDKNLLSGSDHISVRYEDLCRDPDVWINRILAFLGMEPSRERYGSLVETRPVSLSPDVARHARRVRGKLRPYLAHNAYGEESRT
jgi:hypothetical protein